MVPRPWFLLALAAAGACGASTDPEASLSASMTDPSGDGGSADIVSARVTITGNTVYVRVVFTPQTYFADSMLVQFNLDTDEDPATGYTTANPGHVGFGIDCLITVGKLTTTTSGARVSRWDNGTFVAAANGSFITIANGYEATAPLSACDDDGEAQLKVDAFRQVGGTGYTTRQDWAPDPGQPAVLIR